MGRSVVRYGGLETTLFTDKDYYYPGEPVRLYVYTANISRQPITLTFPTSQRYDFAVYGMWGEVWRWSQGRFFIQGGYASQVVDTVVLMPGQSLQYFEVWPQVGAGGYRVPPGGYWVTGWNTFQNGEMLPSPFLYIVIGGGWR